MINKRELAIRRNSVMRKYETPNTHQPRARNAIFLNPSNSWTHEFGKTALCWELLKQGKQFITEAVEKESNKRRDVVCLDNGIAYELETSEKRAKRHYEDWVYVVPLWGAKNDERKIIDEIHYILY